jgi:RNA polymerase sigma factor (sigma-70 family)
MDQLVQAVLTGKQGAATRFYSTYASKIRAYLCGRLAQDQDVEDILQDTFLSAFDSLPLYRGDSSVLTWLLSIARHEVADFYRKRYVRAVVEKTVPLFEETLLELDTPEFVLQKNKIRSQFTRAYKSLSQQYQEILSLRFELGMSVREVSVRMNLSFKATESLLYRARQAFAVAYDTQNGS